MSLKTKTAAPLRPAVVMPPGHGLGAIIAGIVGWILGVALVVACFLVLFAQRRQAEAQFAAITTELHQLTAAKTALILAMNADTDGFLKEQRQQEVDLRSASNEAVKQENAVEARRRQLDGMPVLPPRPAAETAVAAETPAATPARPAAPVVAAAERERRAKAQAELASLLAQKETLLAEYRRRYAEVKTEYLRATDPKRDDIALAKHFLSRYGSSPFAPATAFRSAEKALFELDDSSEARRLYSLIVEKYADSAYTANAKLRLVEMSAEGQRDYWNPIDDRLIRMNRNDELIVMVKAGHAQIPEFVAKEFVVNGGPSKRPRLYRKLPDFVFTPYKQLVPLDDAK